VEGDTSKFALVDLLALGPGAGVSTGQPLSCARVTVRTGVEKNLKGNSSYFSMTDTNGIRHKRTTALGI
jgi:hypothetical protein